MSRLSMAIVFLTIVGTWRVFLWILRAIIGVSNGRTPAQRFKRGVATRVAYRAIVPSRIEWWRN